MTTAEHFRELHARHALFVMPNPWDAGSAKLLASLGFEALATTSAGFAWSSGTMDTRVRRDELVAHGLVVTARAENHLHGIDDLDDTIARLSAYRDAGAACVYAPGLTDLGQIRRVVEEVGIPVNVLALPSAPPLGELAAAGVRRVS